MLILPKTPILPKKRKQKTEDEGRRPEDRAREMEDERQKTNDEI